MPLRRLISHREPFGPKAPITEALVDLRVQVGTELQLERLREFNATLGNAYPKVQTQTEWAGQVRLEPESNSSTVTSTHRVRGFVFRSEDDREVVQVRRDGFTFSLLPQYTQWSDLRDKAKRAWERYVELVAPSAITRTAHRCINRISLPPGPLELEDWFKLHPTTPPELGDLSDLLVRVAIQHPDDKTIVALATLGSAPAQVGVEESAFLFDIDIWNASPRSVNDEIWDLLADLHEYRNDVFFGSLTDATCKEICK